jgi:predicted Fe-Mo cluster-binding NifX family protein
MIIAIPIMRGRVAPVLNWCSRTMIFPASPEGGSAQELWTPELGPSERLQLLRGHGVQTLICGALSLDLQNCAVGLGLKVIPGVAGDIEEVIKAYRQNRLDQPEFWLPGCRRPRRYRQGLWNERRMELTKDQRGEPIKARGGKGSGGGQGGSSGGRCRGDGSGLGAGTGASNSCICPACGAKTPHERGIPCMQMNCPQCGKPMLRE